MTTGFDAPTTAIDDISGDYALDVTHSRLGFVARHAMVTKVRGQFGAFTGTAHIDEANPVLSKPEPGGYVVAGIALVILVCAIAFSKRKSTPIGGSGTPAAPVAEPASATVDA